MKEKITAAMVAREAGVAPATVSRYLQRKDSVREESAKKIEEAILTLGFDVEKKEQQNTRSRPCIIVNIPGIENTFYNEIIRGIRTSADMHGYRVLIHESPLAGNDDVDLFCGLLRDIRAAGVIRLFSDDDKPDAIFAVSDIYAIAALKAVTQLGLRVPEDVMIAGFDNLDLTSMTIPSITTVSQSSCQQGYSACEMLSEILENPGQRPKSVLLAAELLPRESTSPGIKR